MLIPMTCLALGDIQTENIQVENIQTEIDSLDAAKKDTLYFNRPLQSHGSAFLIPYKHFKRINKKDFAFQNYQTANEVLENKIFSFPLLLGNLGKFNSFSINGAYPQQVSTNFNGRALQSIFDKKFNLEQFPSEFFENIETLFGTDAITFSDNSSAAMLNFQEIIYNTSTPYTKIWFAQSGYGSIGADGIFSQNVAKNLNFTFGFRSLFSDGRFENSWLENWNVRSLLRYNISDLSSISFVYNFTNIGNGNNGGFESDSIDFSDEINAVVLYKDLDERLFRNELNLCYSVILKEDTSAAFSSNLFFANEDWAFARQYRAVDSTEFAPPGTWVTPQFGLNLKYEMNIFKILTLRAGTDILSYNLPETAYFNQRKDLEFSAFMHSEIKITDAFSFVQGNRWTKQKEDNFFSTGGKFCYSNDKNINASLDFSFSETRAIPLFSPNLKKEKNLLLLIDAECFFRPLKMSFNLYFRGIYDPIFFAPTYNENLIVNTYPKNIDNYSVLGASVAFETQLFSSIFLKLQAQSNYVNSEMREVKNIFPLFYGNFMAYYQLQVGESILRVGTKLAYSSKFKGLSFVPFNRSYIYKDIELKNRITSIDLFLSAKLGNAYIKASYENLISNEYYFVPLYPAIDGSLRLSLQWSFFD